MIDSLQARNDDFDKSQNTVCCGTGFLPDMKMMVLKDSKCDDMASYVTK